MSQPDAPTQKLIEATGLTIDELRHARREWRETNGMRRILNAEAARLIEAARNGLESCEPEDLPKLQGRIAGIREMIGAANAQHQ